MATRPFLRVLPHARPSPRAADGRTWRIVRFPGCHAGGCAHCSFSQAARGGAYKEGVGCAAFSPSPSSEVTSPRSPLTSNTDTLLDARRSRCSPRRLPHRLHPAHLQHPFSPPTLSPSVALPPSLKMSIFSPHTPRPRRSEACARRTSAWPAEERRRRAYSRGASLARLLFD